MKVFISILALVLSLFTGCGASKSPGKEAITSLEQLNAHGRKIGITENTDDNKLLAEKTPLATVEYYKDALPGYTAVSQGKLDAYIYGKIAMETAIRNGLKGVRLLDETLGASHTMAAAVAPNTKIPDLENKINAFLEEVKANGTLDDMIDRWLVKRDETMPEIPVPKASAIHLAVGTTGIYEPYTYYVGTKLSGYDIELAYRFAAWLGATIEFKVYDYGGIVAAAQSGDVDCIFAALFVDPERAEAISFSQPTYVEEIAVMVRDFGDTPTSTDRNTSGVAYTSLSQLNGKRIGVQTGTTFDEIVLGVLPDAKISYFNTYSDMAAALEANKIDGIPGDDPVLRLMTAENNKLSILSERMDSFEFGFVLPKSKKGEKLLSEINAWLTEIKASGELDEVVSKWTDGAEAEKTLLDYASYPAPNGMLTMATEGAYPPMNYFRGDEVVGFEVDLAARFCKAYGYGLKVEVMNFDGILPAVQSGKADFAAAGITITEERKESVNFSVPYYSGGTAMAVLKGGVGVTAESAATASQPEYTQFSDLSGKTVSMLTGAPFEELVKSKNPAVGEFTFFNSTPDMLLALQSRKTDAILTNNAIAALAVNRNHALAHFSQELKGGAFGLAFAKGDVRRDEWQKAFNAIPHEAVEAAWEKWTGADENAKVLPTQDWPGTNGTVRVAACDTLEPMSYVGGDGEAKGFDLEVLLMIAKAMDVRVEFISMEFAAILSSVQSGKADIGAGSIIITEERAQAVDFVEYYPAAFVLVVRAASASQPEAKETDSFLSGITSSFEKTFIREGRWKLFSTGIGTTMLITLLSILFGTILGFVVFMLCRNGNPAANLVTRFCLWLVQGMPMVVLLMILYYIIFGSVAISGIAVAVIGFTLTFGAAVFGLLKMGVGAVDKGQYEAACALGYSDLRTFFKIILPQALPHVLPSYKGEIVGLIKATAIVGYIAVQDLTKMGDIVRSRTYEAFFPLIAVTIIYFVLEGLIGFLVSKISVNLNPKRRKSADILKGVKTDD